ncbi:MAG: 2Fe-2S iron-sulfur cluster-binding protein, partial [Siculibacillus sp.]|nr:2Fe-2S iron-sulfur cluster-binding protein [Siculibacillus sp.]
MSASFRTASGGRIDRTKRLSFTFDGVRLTGHPGDTLASALLAAGVRLLARSFKYHRPRGLASAGSEEPNALVTVIRDDGRTTPNLAATTVELHDGLVAISQNRWPSLKWDVGALNDLFSPIFVSGFYYKTFMWPKSFWKKVYEPRIRAAAGFGEAPRAADPDRYANRFAHCDVLVIGAGPAGLAAARAAADAGARVIVCDENPEFGGSLLADPGAVIDGMPGADWAASVTAELAGRETVTSLPRTTAFGYYQDNMVGLLERVTDHLAGPPPHLPRERLWQVRAKRVVICAGALERPLVFPENDRLATLPADAARTLLA